MDYPQDGPKRRGAPRSRRRSVRARAPERP
jgi:hypothetical protein